MKPDGLSIDTLASVSFELTPQTDQGSLRDASGIINEAGKSGAAPEFILAGASSTKGRRMLEDVPSYELPPRDDSVHRKSNLQPSAPSISTPKASALKSRRGSAASSSIASSLQFGKSPKGLRGKSRRVSSVSQLAELAQMGHSASFRKRNSSNNGSLESILPTAGGLKQPGSGRRESVDGMSVAFVLPHEEEAYRSAYLTGLARFSYSVIRMFYWAWEDIIGALYVYEVLVIPLRLTKIQDRHPYNDSISWLQETSAVLPILDIVVDVVLMFDAVYTAVKSAREHRKKEQQELAQDKFSTLPGTDKRPFKRLATFIHVWLNGHTMSHIGMVVLYWMIVIQRIPMVVFWSCQLLRIPIISTLIEYISRKEQDPKVNISHIAIVKFVLLIFVSAHYCGLLLYFLCILVGFDTSIDYQSWVIQFSVNNNIEVPIKSFMGVREYMLCIYKGMNALANLGYEATVPKRMEELVLTMLSFLAQVVVEAYILGTLMHYLVKKDPSEQRFHDFMNTVDEYCRSRDLPSDLHKKLKAFFHFQHQMQQQDTGTIIQYLPHTTRVSLAQELYGPVLTRNRFLFRGCNPQFTTSVLMELNEEFLMPGSVVFLMGDMARDLFFAVSGNVERRKQEQVLGVIYGEQNGVNILGEVSFMMSMPHSYTAQASVTGSVTLLTMSRTVFDKLLAPYPEVQEVIVGNLLEEYNMDRKGKIVHQEKGGLDVQVVKERRDIISMIQGALAQRNTDSMGAMKYALQKGDMDGVLELMQDGFDVQTTDYDGRTILHVAAASGDLRLVEVLVKQFDANVAIRDRGDRLPLDDAADGNHALCVNFLLQQTGAEAYKGTKYVRRICYAAAEGSAWQVSRELRHISNASASLYGGRTALHIAARHGRLEVVQRLLKEGAAINAEDDDGLTPLMDAVMGGFTLVSQLLRFNQANLGPKIMKDKGVAAMYFATYASAGDITRIGLFVENGVSPDVSDYDKRTALHVTASDGMLMTVGFLLESCMADANPVDGWGKTPLQDALDEDHLNVAVLIRAHGGTLGPSADPALMEKLQGSDVPTVYQVKKIINKHMRQQTLMQTQSGSIIKDVTGTGRHTLEHKATMMLIPEVPNILQRVKKLLSALKRLEKAIGPTVLMLYTVADSMKDEPAKNATAEVAADEQDPLHASKGVSDHEPQRKSLASLKQSSDPSMSLLVKYVMRINTVGKSITKINTVFLSRAGPPVAQVKDCLTALGLVQIDPSVVLQGMMLSRSDTPDEFFADIHGSFATLLSCRAFAEAMEAGPDMLSEEIDEMVTAISSAVRTFHAAWAELSPDGETEIHFSSLEQQPELAKALDTVKSALVELHIKDATILTKSTFCQALMHVSGVEDPLQANDGDGEEESADDRSETSSVMSSEESGLVLSASDTSRNKHVSKKQEKSILADHQELYDDVCAVLDTAKIELHERNRRRDNGSLLEKLVLKVYTLAGNTLERYFVGLLYDATLQTSNDEFMDDFWMGVLQKLCLLYENRRPDRSAYRMRRLKDRFERLSSRSMSLSRTEFVNALSDVFFADTVGKDIKRSREEERFARWRKDAKGLARLVIYPSGGWFDLWRAVNRIAGVYAFLDVPFRIAFQPFSSFGPWYLYLNCILELLQVFDVLITFFTAYHNRHGVLNTGLRQIRRHYLSTGFLPDFLATIPLDILMLARSPWTYPPGAGGILSPPVTSWLRIPKVVLVGRFWGWLNKRLGASGKRSLATVLYGMIPALFFLGHISACIWWFIGSFRMYSYAEHAYDGTGPSWINNYVGMGFNGDMMTSGSCVTQYMMSFYWVQATLVTNGLVAGMMPTNFVEVMYTSLMMLITLTVFAYVLGEISNAVMEADEDLVKQRSQLTLVTSFIKARNLTQDLVESVLNQFRDLRKVDMAESSQVFDKLSNSLQVEVARCTSRLVVEMVPIMAECNNNFLDALVVLCREQFLTRESYLYRHNEVSDKLYFIAQGALELVQEVGSEITVTGEMSVGDVVGELSFFFGLPQSSGARSKLGSPGAALYVLKREAYKELAKLYPVEEERIIKKVLLEYQGQIDGKDAPAQTQAGSGSGGLLAVEQSMEAAEKRKHDLKVMEMITFAAKGNLSALKRIVKTEGIEVDEVDYQGRSALHVAAAHGHVVVVSWLVNNMADLSALDRNGTSALMEAINHRELGVMKILQAKKATLALDTDKSGEICELAAFGDFEELQLLIENGVSPNAKDYDEKTPLHLAACGGHYEVVQYLVNCAAVVNETDRDGKTPLQIAISHGHRKIADFLLERGGVISGAEMAYTLCDLAAKDDYEGFKALVDAGVDARMQDYDRRSALHLAASNNSVMVGNYLLVSNDIHIDVNILDRYNQTPMDSALRHDNEALQTMLALRNGVPGDDPSLESARLKATAQVEQESAEEEMKFAIHAKEKSIEMAILEECESMEVLAREMSGRLKSICRAYHKTLADVVRSARGSKKGWNSRQNRRYRRLNDNARYLMAAMKEYEQKLELSMRRTRDMDAHIVSMADEDLRHKILHARTLLKDLTSLSENVLATAFKEKFHMVSLQKSRVQSMLRFKTATAAYDGLSNPGGNNLHRSASFNNMQPRFDFLKSFGAAKMAARKFKEALSVTSTAGGDDPTQKNLLVLWARNERRILAQLQDSEPTLDRAASNLRRLRSDTTFGRKDSFVPFEKDDSYAMESFLLSNTDPPLLLDKNEQVAWANLPKDLDEF